MRVGIGWRPKRRVLSSGMVYQPNYYTDTLRQDGVAFPPLNGQAETETLIIGGGLAGLSVAASLAERGDCSVIVLEAGRIAHAASGCNGGQVLPGYSLDGMALTKKIGPAAAQRLFAATLDAQRLIKRRVADYAMPIATPPGFAQLAWWNNPKELQDYAAFHNRHFGTDYLVWDKRRTQQEFRSEKFHGAIVSMACGFQLHPLQYALGLAAAISRAGGAVHELSAALKVWRERSGIIVKIAGGRIRCRRLVLAGNTSLAKNLSPQLYRAVLPLQSFMGVTRPLHGNELDTVRSRLCAYDMRGVMSYFRIVEDGDHHRLLFGCEARVHTSSDCGEIVRQEMAQLYPQLAGVQLERSWSGRIGYGRDYIPLIGRLATDVYYSTGHGGQGLATTALAGEAIAAAITGDEMLLAQFTPFRPQPVNFWPVRHILVPYMLWRTRRADAAPNGSNIASGLT